MRRLGIAAALLLSCSPVAAQRVEPVNTAPVRVQLDSMPLGALATLLMRDVMRVPYVISSDVLNDNRPVSVNLTMPRSDLPVRIVQFLRSMGLTVTLRGGTVYVTKGALSEQGQGGPAVVGPPGFANMPSGSPLSPAHPGGVDPGNVQRFAPPPEYVADPGAPGRAAGVQPAGPQPDNSELAAQPVRPVQIAVITPAHVPVLELVDVLEAVLPDLTFAARRDSAPQGSEIVDHLEPRSLVVSGPREVLDQAAQLVREIDKPRATVEIRAVVFEVRETRTRNSALSILAQLGGIEAAASATPGEQFLRIATGGIRAVLSATRGDGRFKLVAQPSLAAISGTVATLNSGSQVPTVGAVSFGEDGTPVRSIIYRDSGISLTVRPIVRPGGIELAVKQERSSFVRTNTGVDDSPTLNRSTATAQVVIAPGETIALAGLDERSEGDSRSGFFGGLFGSRERDSDQGQLLLLIQADLSESTATGETGVFFLPTTEDEQWQDDKTTDTAPCGSATCASAEGVGLP